MLQSLCKTSVAHRLRARTSQNRSADLYRRYTTRQMQFAPGKTTVGWIGTGVMGNSMCGHLINAGYSAVVYNRTKERAQALIEKGAKWAATPKEVAEQADVVFTIVGFPKDVREVILGETGVMKGLKTGGVVVDMTTSNPSLAQEIATEATKKGCHAVDAPVSGGDIGAREARLTIMIGGEADVVTALNPLLACMGKTIKHLGPAGSGQHTKMVNQILISTMMVGLVEGLLYGQKAGLNLEEVINTVSQGAAGSWSLNNYGPRILRGNYDPGFFVEHFIKDMEIVKEESKRMNLCLPGLDLALELYNQLKQLGHGRKGTHALMMALENINRTKFEPPLAGK